MDKAWHLSEFITAANFAQKSSSNHDTKNLYKCIL